MSSKSTDHTSVPQARDGSADSLNVSSAQLVAISGAGTSKGTREASSSHIICGRRTSRFVFRTDSLRRPNPEAAAYTRIRGGRSAGSRCVCIDFLAQPLAVRQVVSRSEKPVKPHSDDTRSTPPLVDLSHCSRSPRPPLEPSLRGSCPRWLRLQARLRAPCAAGAAASGGTFVARTWTEDVANANRQKAFWQGHFWLLVRFQFPAAWRQAMRTRTEADAQALCVGLLLH
jgi:hypothetical protein